MPMETTIAASRRNDVRLRTRGVNKPPGATSNVGNANPLSPIHLATVALYNSSTSSGGANGEARSLYYLRTCVGRIQPLVGLLPLVTDSIAIGEAA